MNKDKIIGRQNHYKTKSLEEKLYKMKWCIIFCINGKIKI
jgi:hypothetical protein